METSALLASAEDRVVDEAIAVLEPRQHAILGAGKDALVRTYVALAGPDGLAGAAVRTQVVGQGAISLPRCAEEEHS